MGCLGAALVDDRMESSLDVIGFSLKLLGVPSEIMNLLLHWKVKKRRWWNLMVTSKIFWLEIEKTCFSIWWIIIMVLKRFVICLRHILTDDRLIQWCCAHVPCGIINRKMVIISQMDSHVPDLKLISQILDLMR